MPEEPLSYPGDAGRDQPIARRSEEEIEREQRVNHQDGLPGGAEGGDESNSANWLVDHPDDTDPLGDTDQHSDPQNLPPHRERANAEREPPSERRD